MIPAFRPTLLAFSRFVRTPTLGRRVAGLLALAIILLLTLNLAVYFLIQRTVAFNDTVDETQQVRLVSREVLTRLVDAETGQRGFLLTARSEYLTFHDDAIQDLPDLFRDLNGLTVGDPDLQPRIERIEELSDQRLVIMTHSIQLARTGRIGEAVSVMRLGAGKALKQLLLNSRQPIAAITWNVTWKHWRCMKNLKIVIPPMKVSLT